jgi:hypothetical protein
VAEYHGHDPERPRRVESGDAWRARGNAAAEPDTTHGTIGGAVGVNAGRGGNSCSPARSCGQKVFSTMASRATNPVFPFPLLPFRAGRPVSARSDRESSRLPPQDPRRSNHSSTSEDGRSSPQPEPLTSSPHLGARQHAAEKALSDPRRIGPTRVLGQPPVVGALQS